MQINREYEREISITDLFFDLLYHWRPILTAALIGAVVLAALQFATITVIHHQGKTLKEERQYEMDLQNYQDSLRNAQSSIKAYANLLSEQNEYLRESIYINLDSQKEWFASKTYYIKMEPSALEGRPENSMEDPADYVAAAYVSSLKGGLDGAEMLELMGTSDKVYIDELVTILADNVTNTVTLQILGASEDAVVRPMAFFDGRMQEISKQASQSVGAHTLSVVGEESGTRLDVDLATRKDEINKMIAEWQTALMEQRQTEMDLLDKEEPKKPGTHVVRFAAIGFILGAFLVAGIRALKYALGGQVCSAGEIEACLGLPVFGEFAKCRARRSGKGLDKLFEKWEFHQTNTDAEPVYAGISALIREQYAGKRVLLLGTVPEASVQAMRDNLQERLAGACELTAQGGMPHNAAAIADAKQADAVILVEEKYASRMKDIVREAEMLTIDSANTVGCIVI